MPTPVESVTNVIMQGATPAHVDNFFATGRRLASTPKDPTIFMTRS